VIPHPVRWSLPHLLLLAILISSGSIAGCGAGGASSGGDGVRIAGDQFRLSGTQRDAQFAVGSESFTEQEVLGNIAIEVLEAAGPRLSTVQASAAPKPCVRRSSPAR
jgi:glycine betaine/choline ABC-type transport system substrate-binding protein